MSFFHKCTRFSKPKHRNVNGIFVDLALSKTPTPKSTLPPLVKARVIDEDEPGECKCGAPSPGLGLCPYSQDINQEEVECNCCDDCVHQCVMDI